MCGIAGVFSSDIKHGTPELLGLMTRVLRHRGPDDEGYLLVSTPTGRCEPRAGDDIAVELRDMMKHLAAPAEFPIDLAFGHRRLSIIDLSPAGHQPMSNEDGTVWIIHNGEIYNYIELKEELKRRGHRFISKTDTEVILHSYEEWGAECLGRFNGMWAFAIWDGRRRKLFCSRDRFGIKPFYYYFDGERLLFASEIKALLEAGFIERKPDYRVIFEYLVYGGVDCTENTFFEGIKQLRGAHCMEFTPGDKELRIWRYYDLGLGHKLSRLANGEYARRFAELFEDSVRLRLISDVPLGSCLSGGIDSSSIVCMIDKLMREKGLKLPGGEDIQKTFSARYDDKRHDEGLFIHDVIKSTAVDAHYTYPTGKDLRKDLMDLIWYQEEPFGSTSIYAQWEVFKLAKQSGVKVALDGQGADESLAGYHHYFYPLFAHLIASLQWLDLARECWFHARLHDAPVAREMLKAIWLLLPQNPKRLVRRNMRPSDRPWLSKEFAANQAIYPFREEDTDVAEANVFDQHLYKSLMVVGLPALLRYEDKNSMACSIESRVPFLDYRMIEFAFELPWNQKIRRGITKSILRNAMKGLIPESVANRQDKIGFSTPEDDWFRTDLRDEIWEVITSASFRQRPFFDTVKVKEEFETHQSRRRNVSGLIWRWLNLELWLRMFIDRSPGS